MTSKPFLALTLLAALVPQVPAQAEPLGRLFHTPQERRALDRLRAVGARDAITLGEQGLRLDGIVQKSDGTTTAWISGRAAPAGTVGIAGGPQGATIPTPEGSRIRLQVGQILAPGETTPSSPLGDGHARRDGPR